MIPIRQSLAIVFAETFWKKLAAFSLLLLIGWILQDFLALFLITFLFAYIFLELGELLARKVHSWGEKGKEDTPHKLARRYATTNVMVTILYGVFITVVIFIFVNILPKIASEVGEILSKAPIITQQGQDIISKIEAPFNIDLGLEETIGELLNKENLESIGQTILGHIKNAGIVLTKFFIAMILSYIFIMERVKINNFLQQIRQGNFSFFYDEWAIIAKKMGKGFGLIFKAQSIIALVNSVLTTLGLLLISFIHGGSAFPFIFTLSLIVFIFGFIPVFGTFLSGVPILIIAYGYGTDPNDSLIIIVACIAMIAIVHMIEAYYLNPKIVSSYIHFPVFITFVILLISEHYFGLIGLLIGVPLFSIILSFIEDFDQYIDEIRKKFGELK